MLSELSQVLQVVTGLPEAARMAIGIALAVLILGATASLVIRAAAKYRQAGHPPVPKKVVQVAPDSPGADVSPKKPKNLRMRLLALIALLLRLR